MKSKPTRDPATPAGSKAYVGRASRSSTVSLSALKEQAAGLRRAQAMAGLAHVITQPDGSFESWSETLPEILGLQDHEIAPNTRRWLDLIHPEDRAHFRETALEARRQRTRADVEYRLWRSGWVYVRQVMEPIPGDADEQGRVRWFNTIQDITLLKTAEQQIRRLSRVYAVISGINALMVRVRNSQDLFQGACDIAVRDGGFRLVWIGLVDDDGRRLTPVASAGPVGDFFRSARLSLDETDGDFGFVGAVLKSLKPVVSMDIQRDPRILMKEESAERGINSVAVVPLIAEGKAAGVFAVHAFEVGHFDEEEMRILGELANDVAFAMEYIDKREKAEYLAYYDPVTSLANRTLFHERLKQTVADAAGHGTKVGLVLLDLERFRNINDTFGRSAGDQLLRSVAQRVTALIPHVRASRIGADQFAIVVPDIDSAEDLARQVEARIGDFFGMPYGFAAGELKVSGKLGISIYPDDAVDAEALFKNAEAALKKAKRAGEAYVFYEKRMSERISENLALETNLRRALEEEQFVLHYQPKVDIETRRITGVEALIRWQSPEGLVAPGRFIPLLEATGLILPVGAWALRRAALDQRRWAQAVSTPPRVAVNVSALQLRQRRFVDMVADAVGDCAAIDLEITESLLMEDVETNIDKLQAVRSLGINLAIDDFGTGYSSLAYLAKLPVQTLKIDRSFIVSLHDDPDAMTLVNTMISLAHSLRLKVVAEGVETEEQAKLLRLVRCDELQGFLFSRPLAFDVLMQMLSGPAGAG